MSGGNLLVILSDEHQARALGCAGHHWAKTPHLDALAARGTRFTQAYTPSPICVPARASFATGRHVHNTRLWDNAMPYHGQIPGWGHALQDAGVPVESIGKLHYRAEGDPAGFDREHIPMHVVGGHGMVWGSIRRAEDRIVQTNGRMLGPDIGAGHSKYTEYDAAVTERACQWLEDHSNDDQPWCLYVGLVAPHFPLVCPPEFFDLYPEGSVPEPVLHPRTGHVQHPWIALQNGVMNSEAAFADAAERARAFSAYYGLVSWVDHNVGQILNALAAHGLADDTTVVYSSDHGDNVGARGLWGKSNLYEESVAIPMIMAGPGVPVGQCDTPVDLLDLAAMIPAHFGLEFDCDGTDLRAIANAPTQHDREVLSQYHAVGAVSGAYMLRTGRWKLIHYEGFPAELFDLDADPDEAMNLADDPDYATVLADLIARLHAHLDPTATDAQAFADQDALIAHHGGRDAALRLGAPGATPPPDVTRNPDAVT